MSTLTEIASSLRMRCFGRHGALAAIVILVALGIAVPRAVHAAACNGSSSISYPNPPAQDFRGTVDHVAVTIGSGPITGGTHNVIVVSDVIFDLACRHKGCSNDLNTPCSVNSDCGLGNSCQTLLPGTCAPDGSSPGVNTVVGYNGNFSSNCTDGPPPAGTNSPVTFSVNNPGGGAASPNGVVFHSSSPMNIPANTTNFCTLTFDVVKLSGVSYDDTQTIFEERGGYLSGQCDNDIASEALQTGSLQLSNTPTPVRAPAPAASGSGLGALLVGLLVGGTWLLGRRATRPSAD